MLGVIPAAGAARRLQPLPFSKELLPVGSQLKDGSERPRAVSEFIVERLILGGATRLCFVVAPRKLDIITYYGASIDGIPVCYAIQPEPAGLCDAVFRALPFAAPQESMAVGLPDTVWFPADALRTLPPDALSFLLFPVEQPELFDAVVTDDAGRVQQIQVKCPSASSSWIWGAFQAPCPVFRELYALWLERGKQDEYVGSLVNEYLARGGHASAVRAGTSYVDVGTVTGYRRAFASLQEPSPAATTP
ncbi:MAG: nucleotidyltransferase family protein [Myxococcales bacterium]|nr:MAG: nucleotidyltransferase family protein [Myxococcales bacterium]